MVEVERVGVCRARPRASHVFISTQRRNSLRSRTRATAQIIGCAECDCSFPSLARLQALQRHRVVKMNMVEVVRE